jgi:hypothetical protein
MVYNVNRNTYFFQLAFIHEKFCDIELDGCKVQYTFYIQHVYVLCRLHRGLRRRVAALALEVVVSKSETQGHLSGCEGAIRSHLVFSSPELAGHVYLQYSIYKT